MVWVTSACPLSDSVTDTFTDVKYDPSAFGGSSANTCVHRSRHKIAVRTAEYRFMEFLQLFDLS